MVLQKYGIKRHKKHNQQTKTLQRSRSCQPNPGREKREMWSVVVFALLLSGMPLEKFPDDLHSVNVFVLFSCKPYFRDKKIFSSNGRINSTNNLPVQPMSIEQFWLLVEILRDLV
ncbi:MAG TPA: hypothetical protein DCX95_05090 [Elusimicrobia bacterium]|nr:hypothetical protein [Elusimicrobiota bacterium]